MLKTVSINIDVLDSSIKVLVSVHNMSNFTTTKADTPPTKLYHMVHQKQRIEVHDKPHSTSPPFDSLFIPMQRLKVSVWRMRRR